MENKTFSVEEAAAYLKSSVATLDYWRTKNTGPKYYKPSHKIIYYKSDLDAWIKGEKNETAI